MKDGPKDATKTLNPNVGTRIWSNRIQDQHDWTEPFIMASRHKSRWIA